ncbi:MAG: cyclodeaminase/cyclohydrolase family protein [Candidatus Omnitrophica bacterium]|nr:cyclodeaminase/cyclohydrolase family protein [Candidatus Omnitrophota bacterium]
MKKFKNHTLQEYLDVLSKKVPAPGGGSAAALTGAAGAALLSMAANYSLGKGSSKRVETALKKNLERSEKIRKRLVELIDLDAEAYLALVAARKKSEKEKQAALKKARAVPKEIAKQCYNAVQLAPLLVKEGNPYLISDVQSACEMLKAAFQAAMANVEANS